MNATLCCIPTAYGVGDPFADAKIAKAKLEVQAITKVAEILHTRNAKWPATLKEVADSKLFAPPGLPLDPWGKSYCYDVKGPKNGGKRPDIWFETPDKQVVGNWPGPNKKKDK